ncbi:MAG: undecaprenyl-diphosphate phosphatase [Fibrobacterales bacterium]|nr:undecaprenyl-diphosphate phosphatase [Fibrobacterales bacterium]
MNEILLGVVQGLTEFLPVSSSGHLVVFSNILGDGGEGTLLEVLLHFGTLAAVLTVYRKEIFALCAGLVRREREATRKCGLIALACVPTGLIGILFKHPLEALFESPFAVSCALLFTAALLWSVRLVPADRPAKPLDARRALLIGLIQGVAIVPGISRSGSTICGALHLGVDRRTAGDFSFLISVPAVAGAVLLKIKDVAEAGIDASGITGWTLAGVAASFLVGWAALVWLLKFVRKGKMHLFAPYVLAVGLWGIWRFWPI